MLKLFLNRVSPKKLLAVNILPAVEAISYQDLCHVQPTSFQKRLVKSFM